jgi:Spy/CpxP family protein refolding chaperone
MALLSLHRKKKVMTDGMLDLKKRKILLGANVPFFTYKAAAAFAASKTEVNHKTKRGANKMKRHLMATITLLLVLGLMQSVSFADSRTGHHRGGMQERTLGQKFFKKVKMIYLYQDELDVSDKQLDQIKALKIDLKKGVIEKKANMKIIKVDIRSLLHEEKIDVAAVEQLIDQKYEIKKAKMKDIVKAYAKLKEILTQKQIKEFKEIRMDIKKKHMSKGMMRSK